VFPSRPDVQLNWTTLNNSEASIPQFNSIQFNSISRFLCPQAHTLAGWRLETQLTFSIILFQSSPQLAWDPRYTASGRTQPKTPFHNNPFIVTCVFVDAGTCLPRRYIAMNVYSGSTIQAFSRHVTVIIPPLLVLNTFVLYSTDVRFESRLRYRLFWLRLFVVFLKPYRRIPGLYLSTGREKRLPTHSLLHHSLNNLIFDAM
jgi:hypothetical protein